MNFQFTTCHECQQSYFNKTPSKVISMKFKCHYSLKAHQNDQLNISFVKDKHIVRKKMARNGPKMAIYKVIFISKQSILIITLLTFQMSLNESISVILQTICTYICSQECPLTKYLPINYYLCQLKFSLEIYWISIKFWALLTFTFADQMFLAVLFFFEFHFSLF